MKLKNCTVQELAEIGNEKRIFCFGASFMPQEICEEYGEYGFEDKFDYFVDNSPQKQGTVYRLQGKEIQVLSVNELISAITDNDLILITSKYYVEIYEQLEQVPELEEVSCYVWPAIAPAYKSDRDFFRKIKAIEKEGAQIPRKIHYFWMGGNPIPALEQKCIDSWKRVCPDYEIVLWNEDNYDVAKCPYMKQAYESKKWGFVPDYARLDVIYRYGGIYLDTDVEVIKRFDPLLNLEGFVGFESKGLVAFGQGFGAKKGNRMIRAMRDRYEDLRFRLDNGECDLTASTFIQTETLQRFGLEKNNQVQVLDDLAILPKECFCPDNNLIPHVTANTFSIHHFSGSWTSEKNKIMLEKMRAFNQWM